MQAFSNMFRALVFALFCFLTVTVVEGVELDVHSHMLGRADVPPCGTKCVLLHLPGTGCERSDTQCQCESLSLAKAVSTCMLANCTTEDSLSFSRYQGDICHIPAASNTHKVLIYTVVTYPISVFFVALRLIAKVATKGMRAEDWIVVVAVLLAAVPIGTVLKMTTIGFGNHLWDLKSGELILNLKYFYVAWSSYTFILGLMKCSLILLYVKTFTLPKPRLVAYIIFGWIIVNTLVLVFLTIFNCLPVNAFWDRDIKGAKCLDINALALATSVSAIAQDFALLIFPLICIRKLHMELHRKIFIWFMFSIGALGCVASILRLRTLFLFRITIDPTFDYVPVTIWTEIELVSGFVCLSLPAIRLLLSRMFPRSIFASKCQTRTPEEATMSSTGKHFPEFLTIETKKKKKRPSTLTRLSMEISRNTSFSAAGLGWPAGWSPRPWPGNSPKTSPKGHHRLHSSTDFSHLSTRTVPATPSPLGQSFSHTRDSGHQRSSIAMSMSPTSTRATPSPLGQRFEMGSLAPRSPMSPRARTALDNMTDNGHLSPLARVGCLPDAYFSDESLGRQAANGGARHG